MGRALSWLAVLALGATLGGCTATPTTAVPEPATRTVTVTVTPSPSPEPRGREPYLAVLRAADVPLSTTGDPEVLIAVGVCDQLAALTPRASLVHDLATMGGVATQEYAEAMVTAAEAHYCGTSEPLPILAAPAEEPEPVTDPCTPEGYSPSDCSTFYTYVEHDGAGNLRDCDSILGCSAWYAAYEVDRERATELGDVEGAFDEDRYCALYPEDLYC